MVVDSSSSSSDASTLPASRAKHASIFRFNPRSIRFSRPFTARTSNGELHSSGAHASFKASTPTLVGLGWDEGSAQCAAGKVSLKTRILRAWSSLVPEIITPKAETQQVVHSPKMNEKAFFTYSLQHSTLDDPFRREQAAASPVAPVTPLIAHDRTAIESRFSKGSSSPRMHARRSAGPRPSTAPSMAAPRPFIQRPASPSSSNLSSTTTLKSQQQHTPTRKLRHSPSFTPLSLVDEDPFAAHQPMRLIQMHNSSRDVSFSKSMRSTLVRQQAVC